MSPPGSRSASRTLSRRLPLGAVARHHPQRHGGSGGSRAALSPRTPRPAGCRPSAACACSSTGCWNSASSARRSGSEIAARCAASGRSHAGNPGRGRADALRPRRAPPGSWWRRNRKGRCAISNSSPLGPGRALVVLVTADGQVENRVIESPPGLPPSALTAGQQLPERPAGRPVAGRGEAARHRARWPPTAPSWIELTGQVVEAGLATWSGERRRQPDRPRPGPAAGGRHRDRAPRGNPGAVRAAGSAGDDAAAAGPGGALRGGADLHRRGERLVRRAGVSMVVAPARNGRSGSSAPSA